MANPSVLIFSVNKIFSGDSPVRDCTEDLFQ